jgi:hypothetical protein
MSLTNPFRNMIMGDLMKSLLPDFVLGFAFFTALAYAVLGRRFNHQRPAVAMSAALGIALSVGMVWWEERAGLSIRNLGPLAVGFAIIILAAVMYQAIHQVGGTWSGVGIALGASLLISQILNLRWPVGQEIVQTITVVALVTGILAFLMHAHGHTATAVPHVVRVPVEVRQRTNAVHEDHAVSDMIDERFRNLERQIDQTRNQSGEPPDVAAQIKKLLPAEGWLTQRMADLRAKAYRAREGHVARIEEIQQVLSKLPPESKRHAASELAARYKELRLDLRIDRLDKAAAENERRIRDLTQEARQATARYDYPRLLDLLHAAEKLQRHNSHLFKLIERTERKLSGMAKAAARQAQGVTE